MFCPYCGQKNKGRPEYCEKCGRSFTAVGQESDVVCSVCKKDSPADARYCWHCGERFEEDEKESESTKINDQQKVKAGTESDIDEGMDELTDKVEEVSPEEADFEEIFISFSPAEVAVVKSILNAEGIKYFCKGDHIPMGDKCWEPVRFCIYKWDVDKAVDLLKEMENVPPDETVNKEPE